MQNRKFPALVLSVMMAGAFVGCDDTVKEEKKVDVKSDGTVVTEKEKVTEKSDGTIVQEKMKDVDKPADADKDGVKAKVEIEKKD